MRRPSRFADIIGQRQVLEPLSILIASALHNGGALGHILLTGQPGLGKTSIARAITGETGGRLIEVMAAKLEDRAALLNLLLGARRGDVIFIDEIHALRQQTAESIYTAMEDFRLTLVIGEGERAEVVPRSLERFTLVGATTEAGRLLKPLRDRFTWIGQLDYYSEGEIVEIMRRAGARGFDDQALALIAQSSLGTPRRCLKLLEQCRAFMDAQGVPRCDLALAEQALRAFGVHPLGLSRVDLDILRVLRAAGLGVPRGVSALAAQLNIAENVITEMHEPILLRLGLIARTGRGRMLTSAGQRYLEDLNERA